MNQASLATISSELVRAQFPALKNDFVYLENAGGTQVPGCVIDAVSRFFREANVQTYSTYPASREATRILHDAHEFINLLVNGVGVGQVALGQSSTSLLAVLADCIRRKYRSGGEIVVSVANHEANISPWLRLRDEGFDVKFWGVDPVSGESSLEELQKHLTDKTKVVAFAQTSNLLGENMPAREICDLAHSVGAIAVVDAVAYGGHSAVDAQAWNADFVALSMYKIFSPHVGVLYGKTSAWMDLDGPNHSIVPKELGSYKFELGCQAYELLNGILALGDYFKFLAGEDQSKKPDRQTITGAYDQMHRLEKPVLDELGSFLYGRSDIRVVGPKHGDRHPTFSFVSPKHKSKDIVDQVNQSGIGIRSGNLYAYRLCEALGIDVEDGVVRISAVHYNNLHDVAKVIDVLNKII